jgi:hypothetical protein
MSANFAVKILRTLSRGWQAALFPTGYSGMNRIKTGGWRDDAGGPMQVVSGPIGRQRVHSVKNRKLKIRLQGAG